MDYYGWPFAGKTKSSGDKPWGVFQGFLQGPDGISYCSVLELLNSMGMKCSKDMLTVAVASEKPVWICSSLLQETANSKGILILCLCWCG